jgi:hypothetical protein
MFARGADLRGRREQPNDLSLCSNNIGATAVEEPKLLGPRERVELLLADAPIQQLFDQVAVAASERRPSCCAARGELIQKLTWIHGWSVGACKRELVGEEQRERHLTKRERRRVGRIPRRSKEHPVQAEDLVSRRLDPKSRGEAGRAGISISLLRQREVEKARSFDLVAGVGQPRRHLTRRWMSERLRDVLCLVAQEQGQNSRVMVRANQDEGLISMLPELATKLGCQWEGLISRQGPVTWRVRDRTVIACAGGSVDGTNRGYGRFEPGVACGDPPSGRKIIGRHRATIAAGIIRRHPERSHRVGSSL